MRAFTHILVSVFFTMELRSKRQSLSACQELTHLEAFHYPKVKL